MIGADVHEPTAITERLRELGVHVGVSSLPTGDYLTGKIVVERKWVHDLHLTLIRGRFWNQLGRLRATGRRPYLVVEGTSLDEGPLSPAAVRGALLAATDQGITVLRSESQDDSALWIFRAAVRAGRGRSGPNRPAYAQRPKALGPGAAAEAALASVPVDLDRMCAGAPRASREHRGRCSGPRERLRRSLASGLIVRNRSRRPSATRTPPIVLGEAENDRIPPHDQGVLAVVGVVPAPDAARRGSRVAS